MNNKNGIIAAVIIVIAIVAGVAIYNQQASKKHTGMNGADQNPLEAIDGTKMNPGTTPSPTQAMSNPTPTPTAVSGKLSYGEAINKYKNKIQFLSCHGTPGTVAAARGSIVLLDNRDQKSHLIKIGSQSLTIGGLDFALFTPSTKGDFNVTCDGGGAAVLKVD